MTFIPSQCGLNQETELLIKQSRAGACGVDLPDVDNFSLRLGQEKRQKIGLAEDVYFHLKTFELSGEKKDLEKIASYLHNFQGEKEFMYKISDFVKKYFVYHPALCLGMTNEVWHYKAQHLDFVDYVSSLYETTKIISIANCE